MSAIAAPDPKFGETPFVVYHGAAEVDVAALIAVSQVVATHFATIATANNHWRDLT